MKEFGDLIAAARKKIGMSQRELAAKILKEDGQAISVQYLNDIEHGRRNPPSSEHLMAQLAKALAIPKDRLMVHAGYLPNDIMAPIRELVQKQPDQAEKVLRAFRRNLNDLKK